MAEGGGVGNPNSSLYDLLRRAEEFCSSTISSSGNGSNSNNNKEALMRRKDKRLVMSFFTSIQDTQVGTVVVFHGCI